MNTKPCTTQPSLFDSDPGLSPADTHDSTPDPEPAPPGSISSPIEPSPHSHPFDPVDDVPPPVLPDHAADPYDLNPLPAHANRRKLRRNGRVASLPKLQRDMVCRMIWNGVPYKNIVQALDRAGFSLNERNVSNWVTRGGYEEWRLDQEQVLQHRLDQDHLLDFLRRNNAPELPEVGLQVAATRISQLLIHKALHHDDTTLDLEGISKLIVLLAGLNRQLTPLQKQRDDSLRTLGQHHDPARIAEQELLAAIKTERTYSNPGEDLPLPKPAVPALVPPVPASAALAAEDELRRAMEQAHRQENLHRSMQFISGQPIR